MAYRHERSGRDRANVPTTDNLPYTSLPRPPLLRPLVVPYVNHRC